MLRLGITRAPMLSSTPWRGVARAIGVGVVGLASCLVGAHASAHEPTDLMALDAKLEAAELPAAVVDALVERAALQRLRGDWGAALADLNEAYELDPEHPQIALQRGLVLAILGYHPNAEDDLATTEHALAALHRTDRDTTRATALLRRLIAAGPPPTPEHSAHDADAWDDVEDRGEAVQRLEAAREALAASRR